MRRLNWFGFWTLLGLVSGVQLFFADQRLALHPNAWWQALATTLPAWYLWGLLSLVVAWLGRRFRVDRANFGRHFFIHLGASLDLALLQLVAAVGVQDLVHAAAGQPFVFAQKLVDNFTLFYHWNVLIYWTILAVVHARDYHRDLEERRAALAELERRLVPPLPHQPARYARLLKSRWSLLESRPSQFPVWGEDGVLRLPDEPLRHQADRHAPGRSGGDR